MSFEIDRDAANRFRWRVRAANHRIVGASSQGFASRKECMRSARALVGTAVRARKSSAPTRSRIGRGRRVR